MAPGRAQAPQPPVPQPATPQAAAQPAATPQAEPPQPTAPVQAQVPDSSFAELFAQLAARVSGVVVNVSTMKAMAPLPKGSPDTGPNSPGASLDDFFRDFFGEKGLPGAPGGPGAPPVASLGSGFIIDPSGLIVTNNHVIANAEQITVTLSDDTSYQARVVGRDPVTDLALLKVDAK